MDHPQAPTALGRVRDQLGAVLKSDVALDALAPPLPRTGAFRSFVSRTISVIDVQGGAIALHKGASRASDVHLLRLQRGSVQLAHAGGCTTLESGHFVAFRGAQPLQFRHEQHIDLLAVFLPASSVERWLPDWQSAEFVKIENQQAEGRLSFDIARDLLDCSRQLHSDAAELVGETVTRLFARALATASLPHAVAPEDLAEAHRRRVRQFCRNNLGSSSLCVGRVARAIGLSRASLHRLFHDQPQTLMQWVQQERLEACRRALAAPGPAVRTLTDIALSHGFKTPAHFSSAFRQRYGLTPRDYRASAGAADRRPSE